MLGSVSHHHKWLWSPGAIFLIPELRLRGIYNWAYYLLLWLEDLKKIRSDQPWRNKPTLSFWSEGLEMPPIREDSMCWVLVFVHAMSLDRYIRPNIHFSVLSQETLPMALRVLCVVLIAFSSQMSGRHWSFFPIVFLFPECHLLGITQYVAISFWLPLAVCVRSSL